MSNYFDHLLICAQNFLNVYHSETSSSSVAEALLGVFSRVSVPDRIHLDRGSQFTSEMMLELYRLLSVKQSTTSPYHAMGNGLCDNMNKTVKNLLKKVVSERPQDWSRCIIYYTSDVCSKRHITSQYGFYSV